MISPAILREIRRLLDEGNLTHQQIAGQLGVSPGTVSQLASRGRPRPDRPDPRLRYPELFLEGEPPPPLSRCPTCGGHVVLPCLLCQVRELKQAERNRCQTSRTGRPAPRAFGDVD